MQTWKTPDGHTIDIFISDVVTFDDGQVIRRPAEMYEKDKLMGQNPPAKAPPREK
jgi:hypothetical protein